MELLNRKQNDEKSYSTIDPFAKTSAILQARYKYASTVSSSKIQMSKTISKQNRAF